MQSYRTISCGLLQFMFLFSLAATLCFLVCFTHEEAMSPVKCPSCDSTFETLGEHSKHQRSHAAQKNFLFSCGADGCSLRFGTFAGLDVHITREHREIRQRTARLETGNLRCSVEACRASFALTVDLCHHVLKEHFSAGEKVRCPLSQRCGCMNELSNLPSHFSKYHKGWRTDLTYEAPAVEESACGESMSENSQGDANAGSTFQSTPEEPSNDPDVEEQFNLNEFTNKQKLISNLAKFYVMIESELILPASTVQSVSEGYTALLHENLALMKTRLLFELEKLGLENDTVAGIVNRVIFADALYAAHDKCIAPGPWLSTVALRLSYYKKNFKYIEPIEKDLSYDRPAPTFVYYVPIEETLKAMLACPNVQKDVDKSFNRQPWDGKVIHDYYQGIVFQSRNQSGKTLDIFIFQDAFKPTNDRSPVASKHNTLGMYLSLGNLEPHHRADLECLQLVMVIPGYKKIFKDDVLRVRCLDIVVDDLKRLEIEGMLYRGEKINVRLMLLIGDNLGQHEIGGFIGSFSSEYFCRYCPITRTKYQREPWEREPLRTKAEYEEHMQMATVLNEQDPRVVHYKGVKPQNFKCPFNELEQFHVTEPALAPCIAHDVLSGILEQDLPVMIRHFVQENWFSYPELNRMIKEFPLKGNDRNNRPNEIPDSGTTLGGNAVQNWTLLQILPFIIKKRNIKNSKDPFWLLFLSLKEICEYLFAPSSALEQISYLKSAIENYEEDRIILGFKKPKGHFLNHLADLILLLGPPIHLWTLRFESLHSYFRTVARVSHNYINPGKTMTQKQCLYLAYMSTGDFFQTGVTDPKITGRLDIESFHSQDTQNLLLQQNFSASADVLKSVVVDKIKYEKNKDSGWILLGNLDEINIHIGEIECIVCDKGEISILLNTYIARLLSDYGIYQISNSILSQVRVSPRNLKYPCRQSVYKFGQTLCFSLKHSLSNDSEFFI